MPVDELSERGPGPGQLVPGAAHPLGAVADSAGPLQRPDSKIGPSYFMRSTVHRGGGLERTWRTSILPLLEEHHFGELDARAVRSRYGLDALSTVVDRSEEPTGASPRAD